MRLYSNKIFKMNDTWTFTSANATELMEFVDKTVVLRTKQQHLSKGVVHTVDPLTKSVVLVIDGEYKVFTGVNIESLNIEKSE